MVRPRADNYLERQQEILDAAAAMFAKNGFDGTSISMLAEYCGVSKALLYHYYDSKEAMLYDMLLEHCKLLSDTAINAVAVSKQPEKQLRALVRALMERYMTSRDKHIVLMNNLHCLSDEQQKNIKDEERKVIREIKELVKQLNPALKRHEVTSLSMYLMGAINWTYTWFKAQGVVSAQEYADLATSTFLRGITAESS